VQFYRARSFISAKDCGSSFFKSSKTARFVAPIGSLHVTSDPADNIFLECADAAGADYLITGNQRHFPNFWKKTKIISSREFIGIVGPHLLS
jgi:predicted nucleic acid-binding protein